MKKALIAAAIAFAFAPVGAQAQERVGDAALGAASGIILGPVGIVAGAVVGFTMGPEIASAWGVRRQPVSQRRAAYYSRAPRPSTAAPAAYYAPRASTAAPAAVTAAPSSQVASVQTDEPAPPPTPAAVPAAPAPEAAPASVPVQGFE